jgi:hypothetical protein
VRAGDLEYARRRGRGVCILGVCGTVEDVAVRGATALLRRAVRACLRDGHCVAAPEVSGLTMLVSVRVVWLLFLRLLLSPWSHAGLLLEWQATEALSGAGGARHRVKLARQQRRDARSWDGAVAKAMSSGVDGSKLRRGRDRARHASLGAAPLLFRRLPCPLNRAAAAVFFF